MTTSLLIARFGIIILTGLAFPPLTPSRIGYSQVDGHWQLIKQLASLSMKPFLNYSELLLQVWGKPLLSHSSKPILQWSTARFLMPLPLLTAMANRRHGRYTTSGLQLCLTWQKPLMFQVLLLLRSRV